MDGFGRFVEMVRAEAKKRGRVFALESIEGHERDDSRYNDGLEVQELSGFLLTSEQAQMHKHDRIHDVLALHNIPGLDYVWVCWSMDGDELKIRFEPVA